MTDEEKMDLILELLQKLAGDLNEIQTKLLTAETPGEPPQVH